MNRRVLYACVALLSGIADASAQNASDPPAEAQPGPTSDTPVVEHRGQTQGPFSEIGDAARQAGREIGQGARAVGHTAKRVGTGIGHGARDAAHAVGQGTKDAVHGVGDATRGAVYEVKGESTRTNPQTDPPQPQPAP